MTDFPRLLQCLTTGNVEFIIIGGFAATAHGSAHVTVDLDIVYRRTPENMQRLAQALEPLSPYPRGAPSGLPFRFDVGTIERGLNFTSVRARAISICSARLPGVEPTMCSCRIRTSVRFWISSAGSSIWRC